MAEIRINEYSSDYSYNVGTNSYCTVALPMTAIGGPAFEDPSTTGETLDAAIENAAFSHFTATQEGLESFVATFRGPAANWRSAKDYSYQMAITLLTSGYDLDVCRLCPGTHAQGTFSTTDETPKTLAIKAKYAGTFGNNIAVSLKKVQGRTYWNMIVYVVDSLGTKTAVENLTFVFNLDNSSDNIYHVSEISSNFITINASAISSDDVAFTAEGAVLTGGTDRQADGTADEMMSNAIGLATARFALIQDADPTDYIAALNTAKTAGVDVPTASKLRYMEWIYLYTMYVLDILTDKLSYNSNRLILPGWDDLNITEIDGSAVIRMTTISPLHAKMMEVAYNSRCATAFLDIPKCLDRAGVYIDSTDSSREGYAQKVSRYIAPGITDGLFSSHSALFAPWGQYTYVGTSKR